MIIFILVIALLYHSKIIATHVDDHLNYYEIIPPFEGLTDDQWKIQYRNKSLIIDLWDSDVFDIPQNNSIYPKLLAGTIQNIAGSYVRFSQYDEHLLEGIIALPDQGLLRIESTEKYEGLENQRGMIIYHQEDLVKVSKRSQDDKAFWSPFQQTLFRRILAQQTQRRRLVTISRCKIGLIADYSFYTTHRSQPGGIYNYMLSLFNEVSGHIYSQIGLQLVVSYSYIVQSQRDRSGLGLNHGTPSNSVKYINEGVPKLPGIKLNELCMVHVLSSAKFQQDAVGVAYIGTICNRGAFTVISSDNYGKLPRSDFTSVMMHELGHNFGSPHDISTSGASCYPSSHRYVMFASVQPSSRNSHRFSSCSVSSIRKNLALPQKQCPTKFQFYSN